MFRRTCLLASLTAIALLAITSTAEATARHKRLAHKPMPAGKKLPAEVLKVIKMEFPKGKVTGSWLEEKGELEVFVSVPGSSPIEVVFRKKGKSWRLAGFEYPVAKTSLTPRAYTSLLAKHPRARILEVELVFNAGWRFLGYQVTIMESGKVVEVFIKANGMITKDPL